MRMEQTKPKQLLHVLIPYCILFFAAWSIYHFVIERWMGQHIASDTIRELIQSGLIKNLVWTLPAWLLLRRYADYAYVKSQELFRMNKRSLSWLPAFALFAVYLLVSAFRQKGGLSISPDFGMDTVIVVLFVGLTEEMVFRGWLLNVTYTEERKWLAIGCNAVLFLMIHFPIWIVTGAFVDNFKHFGFTSILILSWIFSEAFVRTKNIWIPITLHMFWDLLIFMFLE